MVIIVTKVPTMYYYDYPPITVTIPEQLHYCYSDITNSWILHIVTTNHTQIKSI